MPELVEELLDGRLQRHGLAVRLRGAWRPRRRSPGRAADHLCELVEKALQMGDCLDLLDETFGDEAVVDVERVERVLPFGERARPAQPPATRPLGGASLQLGYARSGLRQQRAVRLVGAVELGADLVEDVAVDVICIRRGA